MTGPELRIFAVSHAGTVRPTNQDALVIGPFVACGTEVRPMLLGADRAERIACAVIDGMGGHAHGEVASRWCAEHLAGRAHAAGDTLEAAALALLSDANALLYDAMARDPASQGMGAAIAGVLVERDQLLVFNVGDCRVYRWQDGFLCQLSVDDALGGDGTRGGLIQALGGAARRTAVEPHLLREQWLPGRRYLVCSDGLFDALSIDAMERALALAPERALACLLDDALAARAADNVSALLLVCE